MQNNSTAPRSTLEVDQITGNKADETASIFSRVYDSLSSTRYVIIRAISCPVPFLRSSIPIIGGRTSVEILCIVALFGLVFSLSGTSGAVADYLGAVVIILAMRNNILSILLGISYERGLFWHKVVAVAAVIQVGLHSTKGSNTIGIVIITAMCLACASYLIKPYFFELFYYVHISCYLVIIPLGLMHFSAKFFSLACIAWALDLMLRYIITQRKVSVKATLLPGNVLRLTFPKCFSYKAGQYAFLMFPPVSRFEYHPFTISSAPEEADMTFHIRELGDWSKSFAAYVKKQIDSGCANDLNQITLDVFLEGPYGSHSLDMDDPKYQVFLLISGGIGITPLHSLHNSLVHQHEKNKLIRKVIFVWSVKDRALIDSMHSSKLKPKYLPLSFQPPIERAPSVRYSGPRDLKIVTPIAKDEENPVPVAAQDEQKISSDFVFFNEFYLTSVRKPEDFDSADINPEVQQWLKFGRPDLAKLFEETVNLCKAEGMKRVAVSVCGPQAMINEVSDLCRLSQMRCASETIRFDYHSEVFDF